MPDLHVQVGMRVAVELVTEEGDQERMEVDIVPDDAADLSQGFLGAGTPLARALLGCRVGQIVPYRAGDIVRARVLSITASSRQAPEDAQAKRAENLRKAVETSDRTNAMLFASSFSGKWGDYDPASIPEAGETKDDEEEK